MGSGSKQLSNQMNNFNLQQATMPVINEQQEEEKDVSPNVIGNTEDVMYELEDDAF